jgi:hypothetical protein
MRTLMIATLSLAIALAPALGCDRIPSLGVPLDDLLARTALPAVERARLADLRGEIARLADDGQMERAREIEEQAMRILGYRKLWLKCGAGTFAWTKPH